MTHKQGRCEHGHQNVCGVVGDEKEGGLGQQCLVLTNVLIDLGLALKVRDGVLSTGDLLVVWECAPNVVFKSGGLGSGFCAVDTLSRLNLNGLLGVMGSEGGKEVSDNKDSVRTLLQLVHRPIISSQYQATYLKCLDKACQITSVRSHHLNALGSESLG